VSDVVNDTDLMREAKTAANQIIRNQADCEMVKAHIEEVRQKLDEVERKLQTAAGRTAIEPLRKQVNNIAEACGAL
jgi:polyhydroxyalkanoate synthesis regulator phasin